MSKKSLVIGTIVSLLVIAVVAYQLDWGQVAATLRAIQPVWAGLALASHLFTYVLRTQRFRVLLGTRESWLKSWGMTNIYGFYLYLLPVKSGELTFPFLAKKYIKAPLVQGTAALLVARILDLMIVALLMPFLLLLFWGSLPGSLRLTIAALSLGILAGWLLLIWLFRQPEKLEPLFERARASRRQLVVRIGDVAARVFSEMRRFYVTQKSWAALALSFGIWLLIPNTMYLLITSLGYSATLFQVYIANMILIPVTLVPLQGFASLGAYELSIVAAFSLFGIPAADSLNIAVGSHIIYLVFSFILGLAGILILQVSKTPGLPEPERKGQDSADHRH